MPKVRAGLCLLEFFSPLWTMWATLALGSNYKYLNNIVAEMQYLSTKTYNNEQVSKVFIQNFS